MTAFCIGLAVCGGLPLAWHLHAVARRWPVDHRPPSGLARQSRSDPPRSLTTPGPDGSQPAEAQR